jgi:hypothetical protein
VQILKRTFFDVVTRIATGAIGIYYNMQGDTILGCEVSFSNGSEEKNFSGKKIQKST